MQWYRAFDSTASRVFIVAEIGINHLGSEEYAIRLVDEAIACGADAVKFQIYRTEEFYHPDAPARDIFARYELSFAAFERIKRYCDNRGIVFFATPLDFSSLRWMMDHRIPLIKVASADITFEPFLREIGRYVRQTGAYAILSTGFVGMQEITRAVRFFPREKLALLYCVSRYPSEAGDMDLSFLSTLTDRFHTTVGFSDHSLQTVFSVAAVALGARIIERHFTDNPSLQEADHPVSLGPEMFRRLVEEIRQLEVAIGSGQKKITDFERKIRPLSMRGLYAARSIQPGERMTARDVLCVRPGEGITVKHYDRYVGKKAKKAYRMYEKL